MAKTASFAVLHFSVAFGVAYLLTGDILVGGAVALIEPAVNTAAFYLHERVWQRIEVGRRRRAASAGDPSSNSDRLLSA